MSNSDEEPDFYTNDEEELDNQDEKSKKDDNKKINISFDDEIEKEEISKNISTSMVENVKIQKNSKKKKQIENRILKNIESDEEEDKKSNKSNNSFINQSDGDDEKDNNEPNFYDEEQNGENISEKEINDDEESNNRSENEDKIKDKFIERNKKKKEELKKKNIVIENIYDINKEFNYSKDNPVFYLKENKCALDKYPWPMSTKQIVKLIEKDNIPYENLKVKLVDLFEFRLRSAFEYVDFIQVIKPEWASNVTYSKIFLDLHNFKVNKEKENSSDKDQDKDKSKEKEKEKDKSDMLPISQSAIPKLAESNTFSMEKKFLGNFNENENENEKGDNKKKNYWPRNKNKFKKGKKRAVEIKGGFTYE